MTKAKIRRVHESDVDAVVDMVHELAEYERAPQECHITTGQLHAALFAEAPALYGHVAEVDGDIVGFALWFLNFSTWRGVHGIYLEDLYVRPSQRSAGFGTALLAALAEECRRRGYARLEWWVLNWNPATVFYRSLGAVRMDKWTVYRLTDEPLHALANEARNPGWPAR